ncbi:MAG: zinc carboxypeptidase [Planctomycetes bacterium]|nr:zinc carboxypeptidase [Planctomycetota bacterium]
MKSLERLCFQVVVAATFIVIVSRTTCLAAEKHRRATGPARIAAQEAAVGPEGASPADRASRNPTSATGWAGPPVWPPYEKLEAVLRLWARQHPRTIKLELLGRSREGRPVYAVTLTDPATDDENKEHALITALHSGLERSATTTVMAIIEWLVSGDRQAREILRHQMVVCLPVPDPDRYVKGEVSPLYGPWSAKGPLNPDKVPEAVYVQRVMDRLQPELHADIHGTNLEFERYIMFESSGTSYSNIALRPYHRDIIRQMDAAALAEGFPSDLGESDAERVFYGPGLANMARRCWPGQPRFYAATYAYYHFHSIISASEVAWEQSGVLRHKRLLQIGNERWPGEYYPGYPTRVILSNTHAALTAYGRTAAERRRSRVELWNRLDEFTFGTLDPAVEGKAVCVLATSAAADRHYLSDPTLEAVVARLRKHPRIDGEAIARFTAGWPAGQNHPKPWFLLQRRADATSDQAGRHGMSKPATPPSIRHGLCLRLRLPYQRARVIDLRLNGFRVKQSEVDGFITWVARGCTYIQIAIPPKRLRDDDLFVVTCQYDPGETRRRWDTWRRLDD